jgi:N6-L-threonylcarbamoyladenine synthase
MLVLAIETSCDETSAALIRDGREVLSNIVASQIDVHARFGGVVPELASRKHLEAISLVIEDALQVAECDLSQVDGIAVTSGPD